MKRIISLALAAVLLASVLVISTSAKDSFGTTVEIPYSDNAPSMEKALPDESWGEKLIHVDKSSVNTGITQYKKNGTVKQDLSIDLYGVWTENTLYLCFVSPDPDLRGAVNFWWGDGIQMVIYPGAVDISMRNGVSTGWTNDDQYEEWDWIGTLAKDDEGTQTSAVAEGNCVVFGDSDSNNLVVKFAIPSTELDYRKGEKLKENDIFSFSLIRIDGSDEDPAEAYVGWLEWGDMFNKTKAWDESVIAAETENPNTTSANTFRLVGKSAAETSAESEQQTVSGDDGVKTPIEQIASEGGGVITPPRTEPSSWAKAEVDAAIEAGLVPAELQTDYNDGISRAELSKMLGVLIDKVYGKAPEKTDSAFSDTTDADVLNAANLGIITGYVDGTFKPSNILKRCEMSVIINRVAKLCGVTVEGFDAEVKFTDTASHWCKGELGWPVHSGIVKGTSETQFSPESTLTVEQTIMMIYRTYEALK